MVDKSNATDAASALIGAVHAEWASLPAKSRPRLVLFRGGLGSYGTETTFGDLESMASGADGTLLVGPLPLQARFGESWWTDETREARYGNLPLRTLSSGLGDHSPQPLRAVLQLQVCGARSKMGACRARHSGWRAFSPRCPAPAAAGSVHRGRSGGCRGASRRHRSRRS
jgi:Alpha/beta-hydrolase family